MIKCKYIAFILIHLVSFTGIAQNRQFNFERIGTKAGLSDPMVSCLIQDRHGFIWVGTRRGLNRYDGHHFKSYYRDWEDSGSLSNSYINKIIEDSKGNIWIATALGLNKLDQKRNRFKHYFPESNQLRSRFGNNITDIVEDHSGKFWVGSDEGVDLFDPETGHFKRFFHDKNDSTSLSDDNITNVLTDSRGDVWVGTMNGGLNKFIPKDSTFIRYQANNRKTDAISGNRISEIFEDSHHRLWIGTRGDGLNLMDEKTGRFTHFKHTSAGNSLSGNNVLCMNEDDYGNLLIGIDKGGLCFLDPSLKKFTHFMHDEMDENSLSDNSVYSILKDHDGNIWAGVFAGGINLNRKSTASFNHYKHNSTPGSLSSNIVLSIFEDRNNDLWVGTDGGGLNYFNQKTGKSELYVYNPSGNSIAANYILALAEDDKDNLWIGTWGNGVSKLNLKTRKFTNFRSQHPADGLSSNNIQCIKVAKDGKIWIGTFEGGLDVYDDQANRFIHFKRNKEDLTTLSDNDILSILQDKSGRIWIGTVNGGISRYEPETNSFIRYNEQNAKLSSNTVYHLMETRDGTIYACTAATGLNYLDASTQRFIRIDPKIAFANEFIFAALEDEKGYIWMSSNKGISRFDPATRLTRNYSVEDGIQADEFKIHSAFKSKSGMLYFGGINGYNSFYPNQVNEKIYDPPMVMTDLLVFNKSLPIAKDENDPSPLKQDISETKTLNLDYDHSVITFEFASLDYATSGKKGYAYKLEGFDKSWMYVKDKNSATYTNLNPGNYTFKVRSQNNSIGFSAHTLTLDVNIIPPFWLSWWFKILMVLAVIFTALGLLSWRTKRLRVQKVLLEKLVEERTHQIQSKNELLKNLNSTKDKLFSIISHDLRGPFHSILGYQNLLVKNYSDLSDKDRLNMILKSQSSSNQVFYLVENLLNWSRIQSNSILHQPVWINIKEAVLEIFDLYGDIAIEKGIHFEYQLPIELIAFADVNILKTVLRNLISNAIKYTPSGGTIRVHASQYNDFIEVKVIDSGIGMNQEQIENLYFLEKKEIKRGTSGEKGSGLGLLLCKDFVSKNGGSISVESLPGKGSTFSFTVPAFSHT